VEESGLFTRKFPIAAANTWSMIRGMQARLGVAILPQLF
jgi:hypothetical protein